MPKRLSSILCLLLSVTIMAGCGGSDSNTRHTWPEHYKSDKVSLDLKDYATSSNLTVSGNDVYYSTLEYEDIPAGKDEDGNDVNPYFKTHARLWKFDMNTIKKTCIAELDSGFDTISGIGINDDGTFSLIVETQNYNETYSDCNTTYNRAYLSADGKETSRVDITDQLAITDTENDFVQQALFADDGSVFIVIGVSTLFELNKDNKLVGSINSSATTIKMAFDTVGKLFICLDGESGSEFYAPDVASGNLGNQLTGFTDENSDYSYTIIDGIGDNNLFIIGKNTLAVYDEEDQTKKDLVKWEDNGVLGNGIFQVAVLEDNSLVCLYGDPMKGAADSIVLLTPSDSASSSNADKQVLTCFTYNTKVQQQILDFNVASDTFKIEMKNYGNEDDPSTALARDIAAGTMPDIIDLSCIDADNFMAKGVFENLTPYLDKDDTVNNNFFVDGLLDSTKYNGSQYYVMDSFMIQTMTGKASELAEYKDGWSAEELIKYVESKPKGTMLTGNANKISVFGTLFMFDTDSYVNWDTGEVSFDSDRFRKLLEFSNQYLSNDEFDFNSPDNPHQMIQDGKQLFYDAFITSTAELQIQQQLYNGDVMYVGYPNSKGLGSYISPTSAFGITASSKNKDTAWEFIKTILTQSDDSDTSDKLPASSSEFEAMIKRDSATEKYINEDGVEVEPRDTTYGVSDLEVKIGPATDNEIQTLRDLIKNNSGACFDNNSIFTMIENEAADYFDGTKDIDYTIDIIQDKMIKYVNENR